MNEIRQTDSHELHAIKNELKADCRALWDAGHKEEAMRLFRLYRRICEELHRRANPALAHLWN